MMWFISRAELKPFTVRETVFRSKVHPFFHFNIIKALLTKLFICSLSLLAIVLFLSIDLFCHRGHHIASYSIL